jgi:hypothetical protein
MLRRSAIAGLAILISTQAHAVCSQSDLKGSWRFEFGTGIVRSDINRLETMSCILRIKWNGAIVPGKCTPMDSSGDEGGFDNPGDRRFRMKASKCEVRITNNSDESLGLMWIDGNDELTRHFGNARLSISENKQVLSGWLSLTNGGTAIMNVTAVKRARP